MDEWKEIEEREREIERRVSGGLVLGGPGVMSAY